MDVFRAVQVTEQMANLPFLSVVHRCGCFVVNTKHVAPVAHSGMYLTVVTSGAHGNASL